MTNLDTIKAEAMKRFDKIGFGNQAVIVGAKRVELKDFLISEIDRAVEAERTETKQSIKDVYKEAFDKFMEKPLIDDLLQKLSTLKEK